MEKKTTEKKEKKNKNVTIWFRDAKSIKAKITDENDINNEIRLATNKAGYRFPRDVQDYKIT
jgi:hypothetical protein